MSKIIDKDIIREGEAFVKSFFEEKLSEDYVFHNFEHARYVAEKSEWIGRNSGLSLEDIDMVVFTAWFHDVGYVYGFEGHEERSSELATMFLKTKNVEQEVIDHVDACIMATRLPQTPGDLLAQVLCDADMAHLAEPDYFDRVELLRKEWKNTLGKKMSKGKFYKISEKFFWQHKYFTEFAKKVLAPGKEKNLQLLEKEIYMLELKKKEEKKLKEKRSYVRGVESMFRNTARMQINLSSIADKKSNILISVNSIIISIMTSVLVSRFEETPNIILPTLIFLFFSLVTIVFAILSTRPHISSGTFSKEDIMNKDVNLLFFGNFYNMDPEDYEWAIGELMKDEKKLYSIMILDQYSLGKVLAKKYKLLRVAYNVFMIGIIVSVLSFVFAFLNI
jgi:predicted metal-dependent HD superfamily phosphohydrolase